MHGTRWGCSPEEELLREHRALVERALQLGHESYVLHWLLAEDRHMADLALGYPEQCLADREECACPV